MNFKVINIVTITGASSGMIGSLLIIIIYLYFKKLRVLYRKLVFILSIYDFLQALSYLLPGQKSKLICYIQFYMLSCFVSAPQFWSASISILSYLKVVKGFSDLKLNKIQNWFHLLMWIKTFSTIWMAIFATKPIQSKAYWCYSDNGKVTFVVYFFLWLYAIICLVFYILIMFRLRKIFKIVSRFDPFQRKNHLNKVWIQLRMSLIPLVYFIIIIPATIRRIREMLHYEKDIPTLDILHSLLITSQGFWDFWIFVIFDPQIRSKIRYCCSEYSRFRVTFNPEKDDDQQSPFTKDFLNQEKQDNYYHLMQMQMK
ncbi:g protein-coupled receptor [Anaeramoeba ignava]|uniref:G protein-coupled receptor n=1 Tax=Anaeramoeba ignava TaxID=1746090 RepID=A0A9Q0LSZ8_ANAIG|nr:g protein-coupled receptor [Anaeramoeba ignava]